MTVDEDELIENNFIEASLSKNEQTFSRDAVEALMRLTYKKAFREGEKSMAAALAEDYGDGCLRYD